MHILVHFPALFNGKYAPIRRAFHYLGSLQTFHNWSKTINERNAANPSFLKWYKTYYNNDLVELSWTMDSKLRGMYKSRWQDVVDNVVSYQSDV